MPHRSRLLNRSNLRSLSRYMSRMLGGAHRPRPPDYLALACTAINEFFKIGKRLRPYMAEQRRFLQESLRNVEVEAALRKVYGPDTGTSNSHPPLSPRGFPPTESEVLKQELALARTRRVVARLRDKLKNR